MKVVVIWDNRRCYNLAMFANMELAKQSVFSKYKDSGKAFSMFPDREDGSICFEIGEGLSKQILTLHPVNVIEVIDTDF